MISKRDTGGTTLTAAYIPSGKWFAAEIVGGQAICTQGRTLAEASSNLRSLVGVMLDEAPWQFPSGPRRPPAGAVFVESFKVLL